MLSRRVATVSPSVRARKRNIDCHTMRRAGKDSHVVSKNQLLSRPATFATATSSRPSSVLCFPFVLQREGRCAQPEGSTLSHRVLRFYPPVSAQAREPIFALSVSGTLFQFEQREPQFAPLSQLPPKITRRRTSPRNLKNQKSAVRHAARVFGATAARTHARYALRCNGSAQAREPTFASSVSGT